MSAGLNAISNIFLPLIRNILSTTTNSAFKPWMKKYVVLMQTYLEKTTPNVSDAWHADEFYVKVKGNPKYLFALMDDQTRF
jgi:putative transposase